MLESQEPESLKKTLPPFNCKDEPRALVTIQPQTHILEGTRPVVQHPMPPLNVIFYCNYKDDKDKYSIGVMRLLPRNKGRHGTEPWPTP